MKPLRKDTIVLVVANPVDVLTYFAQKLSGLPREQVFGSGTVLDSARLRGILARKYQVAASSVSAFVLGEHGDSQVVAWSQVSIGGIPLSKAENQDMLLRTEEADKIAQETKEKAAAIIESKGSTAFGIGGVVASICKSILYDGRSVLTVSHYVEDGDVCLSVPVIVGRKGLSVWRGMPLEKQEKEALTESVRSLKEVIKEVEAK